MIAFLPVLFGIMSAIAATLAAPDISNIALVVAVGIGVMSGMTTTALWKSE